MNTLRATLRLRSALGTPLAADTLFGHICWGLALNEGPEAVTDLLAATESDPPLVLSDPLPAGFWPVPVLPPMAHTDFEALLARAARDRLTAYQRLKSLRKRTWLTHAVWTELSPRLSPAALAGALLDAPPPPALTAAAVPHATIDRLSGGTLAQHGFHFDRQWFPPGPLDFDLWIGTTLPTDRVRTLLEWGLAGGYGRDASAGRGHITVEDLAPAALPTVPNPNAVMTLGPCVPAADDPAVGTWEIDVRVGRLGGPWSVALADTPFKRPLVRLARGAVLLTDTPRPRLGRLVRGVHPTRPEVATSGWTLTLPVRLTEECLLCLRMN